MFQILFSKYDDGSSVVNCCTMHVLYALHLKKLMEFFKAVKNIIYLWKQ